jgi:hypothetical protein
MQRATVPGSEGAFYHEQYPATDSIVCVTRKAYLVLILVSRYGFALRP